MPRRMADPVFRAEQWEHRFDPHVAPINRLVDSLGTDGNSGSAVYVAPHQGGTEAPIISLMSNPGPKAGHGGGSGFISCENDDPTAQRIAEIYAVAGIAQHYTVPWNAYPWYVHDTLKGGGLSARQRTAGLRPLHLFLDLLPDGVVLVAHGGDARRSLEAFQKTYPTYTRSRRIKMRMTWHTGNLALTKDREARLAHLVDTYRWARDQAL